MYKPLRTPERLFWLGQWIIAVLFAYCLSQVGAYLIADLPSVYEPPQLSAFLDKAALDPLEEGIRPIQAAQHQIQEKAQSLQTELNESLQDYHQAKAGFDNWRAARSSTEQSEQNPEVISRAHDLDQYLTHQRALQAQLNALKQEQHKLTQTLLPQQQSIQQLRRQAQEAYQQALYQHSLRVFGLRLAFVGPLLIIALVVFTRYRHTPNWPFVWGFVLFALCAFFVELIPYLPSFGGYIRYGVGAILTFLGGRTLIKALQQYLDRKKHEQEAPQEERKRDIRYEQALDALTRQQCPSCERKLLEVEGTAINFCMHCGLKLYDTCPQCGLRHNAFFPFCPACGKANAEDLKQTESCGN